MRKDKYALILFLLLITVYQMYSNSKTELAKRIIQIQLQHDYFYQEYKYSTEKKSYNFDVSDINIDTSDIIVFKRDTLNNWTDKFNIYHGTDWRTNTSDNLILAITKDNKFYLLKGFEIQNFNQLIENEIGEIKNQEKALNVAKLYLMTVNYSIFSVPIFIEESNIKNYKHLDNRIKKPSISNKYNYISTKIELFFAYSEGSVYKCIIDIYDKKIIKVEFENIIYVEPKPIK